MALRIRKSIKIAPGVKINLSKSGISTSLGTKGATVNLSKRGTRGHHWNSWYWYFELDALQVENQASCTSSAT